MDEITWEPRRKLCYCVIIYLRELGCGNVNRIQVTRRRVYWLTSMRLSVPNTQEISLRGTYLSTPCYV
jgi:hypothetical protein